MRKKVSYNKNHPERRWGEVFLYNSFVEDFKKINYTTKRMGRKAYKSSGEELSEYPDCFPVFIKKWEYEKGSFKRAQNLLLVIAWVRFIGVLGLLFLIWLTVSTLFNVSSFLLVGVLFGIEVFIYFLLMCLKRRYKKHPGRISSKLERREIREFDKQMMKSVANE